MILKVNISDVDIVSFYSNTICHLSSPHFENEKKEKLQAAESRKQDETGRMFLRQEMAGK
jgi:hypothetical protein